MKNLKDGIRALVRLDFEGHVHKTYRGSGIEDRYSQEIAVLKTLEERGCDYVPRLLEEHPEEFRIVTTSCGAPAPSLSRKKATSLFQALERDFGIRHDDPEPRNVTYSPQMGRFCLIDFELATILPAPDSTTELAPTSDVWKLRWQGRTEKGSKHVANDDAFTILGISPDGVDIRPATSEALLEPEHTLLAISDGMGGQNAGELASRLILSWMKRRAPFIYESLTNDPETLTPLEATLKEAHQGLNSLSENDPQISNMGATATVAYISAGRLHVAHIGDSRLYLHRAGQTRQLTSDHSLAWQQWQLSKGSEYTYRNHPRRAALYRSLGSGKQSIHPDLFTLDLEHGDRLLLCTDGIVDGLWQDHIHQALSQQAPLEEIATALHKRAISNCGKDDSTFILAEIQQV